MDLASLVNVSTIFWIILVAASIHVFEEYIGGFVDMMKKQGPSIFRGMTVGVFAAVNTVFIILCVLAAIINTAVPAFSLSIGALLFINAFIHVAASLRVKRYSPGLISAVLLYIPLSVCAYFLYVRSQLLTFADFLLSVAGGGMWMAMAILFGVLWSRLAMRTR